MLAVSTLAVAGCSSKAVAPADTVTVREVSGVGLIVGARGAAERDQKAIDGVVARSCAARVLTAGECRAHQTASDAAWDLFRGRGAV